MAIIGHPIGDFDSNIIIPDIYVPDNFQSGWYFLRDNQYLFMSTDIDPDIEEVVNQGDMFYITGFEPVSTSPSGTFPFPYHNYTKTITYPSGIPYVIKTGKYWEVFTDIDNPYTFVPYYDSDEYGEIVYLDIDGSTLPRKTVQVEFIEQVLSGTALIFKEKLIEDKTVSLSLKDKIISLLNVDLKMKDKNTLILTWSGDPVEQIEILRKSIGQLDYDEPVATVPWQPNEWEFDIENNSITLSVRGIHNTGISLNEITVGVDGEVAIEADIDLGDFVKYYEIGMSVIKDYEVQIGF